MDEPRLPYVFRFWEETANHGLAGGKLDASNHLRRAGVDVVDLDLEIDWMLSEAQYHANWGA